MIEYGWPLAAPRTLAERIAEMTEAARYLHGDLLDLAADMDAEMHAEPTYHDGYETGRRDEAQAQAALAKRKPEPAEAPRPIAPADVRKGDRVRVVWHSESECVVAGPFEPEWRGIRTDQGPFSLEDATLYLPDRPNPDAELIRTLAEAARRVDTSANQHCQTFEQVAQSYRVIARAALAAIRKTHTIEPRPTTGDLHA